MNKALMIGRLTDNPKIFKATDQDGKETITARYTLAVDRRMKAQEGQQTADYISCVAFGRNGEFAEKFLKKGIKIAICGRIQTGSYTNKDGNKVYTTDVVVEEHDFCEKKQDSEQTAPVSEDGFMNVPEGIEDNLPFK